MNLNDYVKPQVLSNMRCVAYLIDLMTGLLRDLTDFVSFLEHGNQQITGIKRPPTPAAGNLGQENTTH